VRVSRFKNQKTAPYNTRIWKDKINSADIGIQFNTKALDCRCYELILHASNDEFDTWKVTMKFSIVYKAK